MEETDIESIGHGRSSTRCCFCIPSSVVWWERIRTAQSDDRWWTRGFRAFYKVREWSEIVAGPKWKTFIRRFNRSKSGGSSGSGSRHQGKFQYDPLSYALNFDEGPPEEDDDFRDFSARFASIPVKSSGHADLAHVGNKEVPAYA